MDSATPPVPPGESLTAIQKDYLQGFTAGLAAAGLLGSGAAPAAARASSSELWFGTPLDDLCREERLKVEEDPFTIWDRMLENARTNTPPAAGDVFRYKYHGLFYVAPAQDSFMVRVRVPGNVLRAAQLRALAGMARELGGGFCDITTRGNIQIREIAPRATIELLMRLAECGLSSRGSGADNVRNVTASPGAGFDPDELIDTREMARAMQFCLNHHADLFGLPRKFNIAFDGAGRFSNVAATNDIAFTATRLAADPSAPVVFRVGLAGITGHLRFATDAGIVVAPEDAVALAAAMLRVFAREGDRTDRNKARLCYLIDRIGMASFLEKTQEVLGAPLTYASASDYLPRPAVDKRAHLGVHPQAQAGLFYAGLAIPVGRLSALEMDAVAGLAERYSGGEIRTSVWQNAILPNVRAADLPALTAELAQLGFADNSPGLPAQFVACTGNTGCRFAASDTKGHARELARALHDAVEIDTPLNVHLTGCPHSCAQHFVADIGLLGAQVDTGSGASVEGYHVYVGGGCEQEEGLGRELARSVPFGEVAPLLIALVREYQKSRAPGETFVAYCARHEIETLRASATRAVSA
jgi:ferredoxin-nitrite reductase